MLGVRTAGEKAQAGAEQVFELQRRELLELLGEGWRRVPDVLVQAGDQVGEDDMRCAEFHAELPYSSEHVWNADIHGIPCGPCLRCGEQYAVYNDRVRKEIETLLGKLSEICVGIE